MSNTHLYQNPLVIVKALEDGVSVLFSAEEGSEGPHPERLDCGEVLLIPVAAHRVIRVRGHAQVFTPEHVVESESGLVIGGHS
jgi:hypothetical protein